MINLYLQFDSLRTRSPDSYSYLTTRLAVAEILARTVGQPFVLDYVVETRTEEFASPFEYLLKRSRAAVTADPLAARVRVYNPAALGENQGGTLIHGLRVVALSPPTPVGANLLAKPWNLPAHSTRSSQDPIGQIALYSENLPDATTAVQRVPIEPNSLYLVKFECKNALTQGDQRVFVSALDKESNTLETYPTGAGYICPSSLDWSRGAVLFESPADTVRARVLLQNRGQGMVWFRNVQLQRATQQVLP